MLCADKAKRLVTGRYHLGPAGKNRLWPGLSGVSPSGSLLRSMCPTRITPRRELNSVRLTEAHNDHELPHVLERAVVLATGPML